MPARSPSQEGITLKILAFETSAKAASVALLDGGKLLGSVINNYAIPCVLGLLLCLGLGIWSLLEARWLNVMILGYLGFINWQYLAVFLRRRK